MIGGILERLEGLVGLEAFRQVLCALCAEPVVLEAASKEVSRKRALSAAADRCQIGKDVGGPRT